MSYKPFTSTLARVHTSGISSSDQEAVPPVDKGDSVDSELAESKSSAIDEIIETIFNRRVAKKYNYKLSRDVEKEAVSLLPQHTVRKRGSVEPSLGCRGADADISLKALIGCMVIAIVVFPLMYVFFIFVHPELIKPQHGA
ncbi:uncharacterized protein LOC126883910 [Diabrotica virgifera virgifera]|uniref:Uncharacterized protein n=1 Tax=Diabrotica virgifera virgifera TaxID=50390 RepID=A0ABM5K5W3_DIAVI|nr:uncharacterized protein LOC126883910 [Diabrotica virgifera virgifera]